MIKNMIYAFELGNHADLSTAELRAVFSGLPGSWSPDHRAVLSGKKTYLLAKTSNPIDTYGLMRRLGGTVKILEQIPAKLNIPLSHSITNYLTQIIPAGKITFSLSGQNAKTIALEVKKIQKAAGRSVRYIEPKNTATILHNHLVVKQTDLTIINDNLFVTRAIQPIAEFSHRDYGRPGRDGRSGMLPPKLAKMLINLSGAKTNDILLDPFCGSGTILMEALLMGHKHLIGTDISPQAIKNTQQNLAWLKKNKIITEECNYNISIYQLDVRHLSKKIQPSSIDHIIFEPYLGEPLTGKEQKWQLDKQINKLKMLYTETFTACHQVLKPAGTITCVIPRFHHSSGWIKIDMEQEIKNLDFTIIPLSDLTSSLFYHRDHQHIGREIWQYQK